MKTPDATTILRNLPAAFWDVAVWSRDGEDLISSCASLDIADRRRIVEKVLAMIEATS